MSEAVRPVCFFSVHGQEAHSPCTHPLSKCLSPFALHQTQSELARLLCSRARARSPDSESFGGAVSIAQARSALTILRTVVDYRQSDSNALLELAALALASPRRDSTLAIVCCLSSIKSACSEADLYQPGNAESRDSHCIAHLVPLSLVGHHMFEDNLSVELRGSTLVALSVRLHPRTLAVICVQSVHCVGVEQSEQRTRHRRAFAAPALRFMRPGRWLCIEGAVR